MKKKKLKMVMEASQDYTLWAGSEASLNAVEMALSNLDIQAMWQNEDEDEDDEESPQPSSVTLAGNVGILTISGALTNVDAWYNKYIGAMSYGEIREALAWLATKQGVDTILLDINSPGGSVYGLSDVSDMIQMVDSNIKPVYAFTDGMMASAAYWIGCSARETHCSNVSMVGSIGVIVRHMERSQALKDAGIGVTVIRGGEYKALASDVEPLSAKARAQIEDMVESAYKVFVQHVADAKNLPYEYVDANMAQGREFFGVKAVEAGLAKSVTTFDKFLTTLQAKFDKEKNATKNQANQQGEDVMRKFAMTPEQLLAAVQTGAGEAPKDEGTETPENEAVTRSSEAEAGAETLDASKTTESDLVAYLKAELAAKDQALIQAGVKLADLTMKVDGHAATLAALSEIVAQSASNMRVALAMPKVDMSALSAETLVSEHKTLATTFASTFKVGGVAATTPDVDEPTKAKVDPRQRALAAAAAGRKA